MKTLTLPSSVRAFFSILLLGPSLGMAADVVLQKAPPLTVRQAPDYPENLARYHFGADVKSTPESASLAGLQLSAKAQDENTSAAALLCDDPTTGYRLPAGASSILVSLPNIENIQTIAFLNDGAKGEMAITVSSADVPENSPAWRRIDNLALAPGAVATKVGPGEAKYVKLSFKIDQPGRIAAFGIYATPALSDFTMPRPRKVSFEESSESFALINFNFSDVHAKARALYVSSGELSRANAMLDDQPATAYQFAPEDDSPTAVIDLGRERILSRLSAIYAAQPGSVDFYVLNHLPADTSDDADVNEASVQQVAIIDQGADLPASLKISEQTFAQLTPVGSIVSTGEGRASVNFPKVTGRYVMLKWQPAARGEAFAIAQVAAFGPPKRVGAAGEMVYAQSDGKQLFDGKEILDDKDIPAEGEALPPAEGPPPALPPVPPFTFIPEVPPTSP